MGKKPLLFVLQSHISLGILIILKRKKGAKYMIRIAVADDDRECTTQLCQYIEDFSRESGYNCDVTVYHDGDELVERYKAQFDIILLDVEMPFLNGMTAAEMIRRQDPEVIIIFITNMAQYAIRGYAVDALDYVLKPVNYFAFSQRLSRAIQRMDRRERTYLTIPVKGGAVKLAVRDIYYVESRGHQLIYHTRTGDHSAAGGTIQQAEEDLKDHGFFRSNKGYLVNLEHVDGVRDGCALVHGEQLIISRTRKSAFLEALTNYVSGLGR